MQPPATYYPYPLCTTPAPLHTTMHQARANQFHAGFDEDGPFVEVGFPGFYGNPSFGAGFDGEEPYMDEGFPKWLFGSPYPGPGPFSW